MMCLVELSSLLWARHRQRISRVCQCPVALHPIRCLEVLEEVNQQQERIICLVAQVVVAHRLQVANVVVLGQIVNHQWVEWEQEECLLE